MTIAAYLRDLHARDIKIDLKGDRLHLSAAEGVLTNELRAGIGLRKAEIIAFLKDVDRASKDDFVLRKAPRDEPLPLSFAQQRLWFLHKLDPTSPVYNIGASMWVPGMVDSDLLNQSLRELARRHETLRTVFTEVDGVPSQTITDTLPVLGVADVMDVPEDRREHQAALIVNAEVERPFDLADEPAFRALLVRQAEDTTRVVLVVHHILADGWSLGVMVREMGDIYAALKAGREPEHVQLPWQYVDYAYSEQRWFAESDQHVHVDYWKEKLAGTITPLDLPFDRPRERILSSNGASYGFTIPAELANQLRALSRQSGVTLFTTLLTVFKTLLHRYSGQDDIVVGTAVANRKRVELEALIGMFVSTLVLRTDLSGDPSVRELLQRVHDTVLDANEHQDYPFEKLLDLVHLERSREHSPLFQSSFVLHNTPGRGTYDNIGAGSIFELSLYVWDGAEELPALLEYNPDLFDVGTIERMQQHYVTLLTAMVSNPDSHIAELSPIPASQLEQILVQWNDTATSSPETRCVHQIIEQQAALTPDAIAVVSGSDTLTYAELERRADLLARHLETLGVGRNDLVGVYMERSLDMVVAMLGTLRAGAAYVPFDPAYPAARLAFMVGDAKPVVLITDSTCVDSVPSSQAKLICLDRDWGRVASTAMHPAVTRGAKRPATSGDDLVYVIYTSGSTGQPKGAMIRHRGLSNYLDWAVRAYDMAAGTGAPLHSSIAFDLTVTSLWGPLMVGRTVFMLPEGKSGIEPLADALRGQHDFSVVKLTPAHLEALSLTIGNAAINKAARVYVIGGEALIGEKLAWWQKRAPESVFVNEYGPTETVVGCSAEFLMASDRVRGPVSIGRPIANTRMYVLNHDERPVPIGVAGELYVGGRGVAAGYLNRPDLTEAAFVPDRFAGGEARLYKTGDSARWLPSGQLEFLGRADDQVKVRGYRIELGEIESVLAAHESVQNAVVIVHEHTPGDQRLIAYVVGTDRDAASSIDLRHWLMDLLPQYMIPSAFVFVDAFPLTPNGKVDRRALLSAGVGEPLASQLPIPPQPGLESVVAQVWRETLGLSQVWANDNFFDLGGNSLLGIRLLARLEKTIGQRLPVSVLFEGQTVRAMTERLGMDSDDDPLSIAVRIKSGSETQSPLFIIPGLNGNVIGYETLAQLLGDDQPVYGLRSVGLNGEAEPLDQLGLIAERFIENVRKVQPTGPYRFCGFCIGGSVAYEMAQQLTKQGEQVELLAMIGTWPPSGVDDMVTTPPSAHKLAFIREGIGRHVRTMFEQPRGQRLAYLRKKLGIIVEMVTRRDVYRGDTTAHYHDWVSASNKRAASGYAPAPYDGDALLVLPNSLNVPEEEDPRVTWRDLVQGETTIIQLQGDDSGALLRPPHMSGLADVLSERLADSTHYSESL